MRVAIAIAVPVLVLLNGAAEAQLRSTSLKRESDKADQEFQKRNEKTRLAIVIPTRPSNLSEYKDHPNAARDAIEEACKIAARDSKMVFIQAGAPPCGCCVAFINYHLLKEVYETLGKHYVVVDI